MRADPAPPTGDLANRDWWRQAQLAGAPSVLLATDRSDWCDGAVEALEVGGFVVRADPIAEAILQRAVPVDLAIVDLAPPHLEGVALVRALRASGPMPILVVVPSLTSETGLLEAFAAGADGCLTRPTRFRELVTRARTLLRHAPRRPTVLSGSIELQAGALRLDPVGGSVTVAGQAIDLTPVETLLLQALLTRPGRVVPRRELATVGPEPLNNAAVDSLVRRLRTKLEAAEGRRRIVTVRGVGFCFLPADDPAPPSPSETGRAEGLADPVEPSFHGEPLGPAGVGPDGPADAAPAVLDVRPGPGSAVRGDVPDLAPAG